jgi:hypothetical protein
MAFFLTVYQNHVGLDPAVGGQSHGAIAHPLCSADWFSEVDF